jgi:hypothetical protein
MRRRCATLEPVDVEFGAIEVDLLPLKVDHLGGAQSVPVGHQHHQAVAGAVADAAGTLDQLLDLGVGQVRNRWPRPAKRVNRSQASLGIFMILTSLAVLALWAFR